MANKFDKLIKSVSRWFSGDSAEALKAGRAARRNAAERRSRITPHLKASEDGIRIKRTEVDDLGAKIDNFRMSDPNMLIRYTNPVFRGMSNEDINTLFTAVKKGLISDTELARILKLPNQAYTKLNGKLVGVKQDFTKALQDFKTQLSDLHKAINTPSRNIGELWDLKSSHRAAQARLSQAERLLKDMKKEILKMPSEAFQNAYDKVVNPVRNKWLDSLQLVVGSIGAGALGIGGVNLYDYASDNNWGLNWLRRNLNLGFNEYADTKDTASSDSESPAGTTADTSTNTKSKASDSADSSDNKGTKKSRTGAITGTLGGGIASAILANKLAERYAKNHKTLATVGGGILGAIGGGLVGSYLDKKYGA